MVVKREQPSDFVRRKSSRSEEKKNANNVYCRRTIIIEMVYCALAVA
jgi:hypothetical protein